MSERKKIANNRKDAIKAVNDLSDKDNVAWHLKNGLWGHWFDSNPQAIVNSINKESVFTTDVDEVVNDDESVDVWVDNKFDCDMYC